MANTAFQTIYRKEYIAGFEFNQSLLRHACVTEANVNGNTAVFLVADSGSATATTRGSNGLIPARSDNQTQNSCTLAEWHDLVRKTGFTVDMSQGNQREMMRMTGMAVLNRKMEDDIIAVLDGATNDTGTSQPASLNLVAKSLAILGNNDVPVDDTENMFGLISPAFYAYLMQVKEFASSDYVDVKPFSGSGQARKFKRWYGVNWLQSTRITGKGTSTEKCYIFHRNSIGHAINKDNLEIAVGVNEEQAYSFNRTTAYMGSKLLQNSGIVQMKHDGSAYVAS